MSLTDLKKSKKTVVKKKDFTVDEFISDAENYAKGTPTLVSAKDESTLDLKQAITIAEQCAEKEEKNDSKPFRHATFTLSENAIEQLQSLAAETNLAKSRIIRILINELCNKEQHQQLKKLLSSKVN